MFIISRNSCSLFRSQTHPATNLHGEDKVGTSDVYTELKLYKAKRFLDKKLATAKTEIIKSLNPVWNQDFTFSIASTKNVYLKLVVWDKDLLSSDKMGECEIKLKDVNLSSTPTEVTKVVDYHLLSPNEEITVILKLED